MLTISSSEPLKGVSLAVLIDIQLTIILCGSTLTSEVSAHLCCWRERAASSCFASWQPTNGRRGGTAWICIVIVTASHSHSHRLVVIVTASQ